jgi:hypothetical protein
VGTSTLFGVLAAALLTQLAARWTRGCETPPIERFVSIPWLVAFVAIAGVIRAAPTAVGIAAICGSCSFLAAMGVLGWLRARRLWTDDTGSST